MPNVITHGLMANEVVQILSESSITKAISSSTRAFFFGSNGPDFLFYYCALSQDDEAKAIRNIGNQFHDTHINEFYSVAKEMIHEFEGKQKEIALAYIAGHLCHWALDSLAHPYIFHKTGLIEGDTRYDHYRMEAMIDTLVVKQVKNENFSRIPSYKFVELDEMERIVIAKIYQRIILKVLQQRIELRKIHQAIVETYQMNRVLWDRRGLKAKVIKLVEQWVLKDPWVFSSHFVIPTVDLKRDILNLKHTSWTHPCDDSLIYTTSFMDLFKQSLMRASQALQYLEADLEQGQPSLEEFIDNRNYSTGLNVDLPMIHFNLIYQH